jgi:hypothetical protein
LGANLKNLFRKFLGKNVEIITKTKISEEIATEVGVSLIHAPLREEGILVDFDTEFLYIGPSKNAVNIAVSRNNISTVKVIAKVEKIAEIPGDPEAGTFH